MESRGRIETERSSRLYAMAIVFALLGIVGVGFLTREDPADPQDARISLPPVPSLAAPLAPTPEPSAVSPEPTARFPDGGELALGRHVAVVGPVTFSFEIPSRAWFGGSGSEPGSGSLGTMWLTRTGGPTIRISRPERVAEDPCIEAAAAPIGPSATDLADAVSRLPGVAALRWDMTLGGFPVTRVDLAIPEAVPCPTDRFSLWDLSDAPDGTGPPDLVRSAALGGTVAMWIVDISGSRLVIDAEEERGAPIGVDPVVTRLIHSIRFIAPFAPDGPFADIPPLEEIGPPGPGPLVPGWYSAVVGRSRLEAGAGVDRWAFAYRIRTTGWSSGQVDERAGTLSRGGSAVLRFSSPDVVATDPCAGKLEPRGGGSRELADAIAAIPGLRVRRAGPIPLDAGGTLESLVLTIPDDLPCPPERFQLWYQSGIDTFVGPRTATAAGSTIRIWIFEEGSPPSPPIVVDAQTFAGAPPALVREIEGIVASIVPYGG